MFEEIAGWMIAISIITIIVYIILCFVVASVAGKRGHSYAGFFLLSFFFSPIIGIIVALLMQSNAPKAEQTQHQSGERRKCPFCAEWVAQEAKVCKHCQRELPAIVPSEDGPKIIEIQNIEQATGVRLKINDLQDGEAQTAGIRRGDIILSYGDVQIHTIKELSSALIKFAGSQVQLVILRGMEEYGCYFTVSPLEAASTSFLGIMKSGLLAVELEDGSNQQVVSAQAERDVQAVITQATSAPQSKATIYAVVGALIFAVVGGVGYWGLTQQKTAEDSRI